MVLPTNIAEGNTGHIGHTNDVHDFYNRMVTVGRSVIYVDATSGADFNDGLSLAYAKKTLAGAIAAADRGYEIRFTPGTYAETSPVVVPSSKSGLLLQGAGGISRNWNIGTIFSAQTPGMNLLEFASGGVTGVVAEGPQLNNINFVDSTSRTATLLRIYNQNRWRLERCTFKDGATGLWSHEDFTASGNDNAWNTLDHCTFTGNLVGINSGSGAGYRDYGSEFTATGSVEPLNNTRAIQGINQHCKFFGTYFDGYGPGDFEANHVGFIACKFEDAGLWWQTGYPTLVIKGSGDYLYGNHNVIAFCEFGAYTGHEPSTAYIDIEAGARFTHIIGNDWVNGGTYVRDNGFKTMNWNMRDVLDTYSVGNVTPDRSFNADTVSVSELADVVGTLIGDLQDRGLII